ncbi:MAG TPA: LytTR family DNA-binding domain-containing protein [Longimicrobiales bacterium]|nr:LytTR family DNA-binding domain-containing protein [Longimicrobiales bacterium]
MTFRTIVVDDEPIARTRLQRLLQKHADVDVVASCATGEAALEAVRALRPDVLFLDVQMPELDGFEVLHALGPDAVPVVVFVTAYDPYAVRAFEVHAIDYLLKPFTPERLDAALQHARSQLSDRQRPGPARLEELLQTLVGSHAELGKLLDGASRRYLRRVLIKQRGGIFYLPVTEINWIKTAGNYLQIHTASGSYLIRETLAHLESRLDPDLFLRTHRTTLVRTDFIKEVRPWFAGDFVVELRDGTKLKLSRRFADRLWKATEG